MPSAEWPPDLWDPHIVAKAADHRPVQGAMAPYLGPQYSAEELWDSYRIYDDVDPDEEAQLQPLAARIRAFDVAVLRDVTFTIDRLHNFAPALWALLAERLPSSAWAPFDDLGVVAPDLKYGIIHEVMKAPADNTTGEPMVLEVYGHLTQINGQPVGVSWYRAFRPKDPPGTDAVVIGEMTFRLERATYANTRWPGVGVPFYL
jgi:hypothetical protein